MSEERIRQVLRDELSSSWYRQWWLNYGLSDLIRREVGSRLPSQVRDEVSSQVNQAVRSAVALRQLDAQREIRDSLREQSSFRELVQESVQEARRAVEGPLATAEHRITEAVNRAVEGVVRDDRYNLINQSFLSDLRRRSDESLGQTERQAKERVEAVLADCLRSTEESKELRAEVRSLRRWTVGLSLGAIGASALALIGWLRS